MHWHRRVASVLVAVAVAVPLGGAGATLTGSAAGATGPVPLYTDPGLTTPGSIAARTRRRARGSSTRTPTASAGSPLPARSRSSPTRVTRSAPATSRAGPDGALWFTNLDASIGRIDATTDVVTQLHRRRRLAGEGHHGGTRRRAVVHRRRQRRDRPDRPVQPRHHRVRRRERLRPDEHHRGSRRRVVVHQPRHPATIGRIDPTTHAITKFAASINGPPSITDGARRRAVVHERHLAESDRSDDDERIGEELRRSRQQGARRRLDHAGARTARCGSSTGRRSRSDGSPPAGRSPSSTTSASAASTRSASPRGPTARCGSPKISGSCRFAGRDRTHDRDGAERAAQPGCAHVRTQGALVAWKAPVDQRRFADHRLHDHAVQRAARTRRRRPSTRRRRAMSSPVCTRARSTASRSSPGTRTARAPCRWVRTRSSSVHRTRRPNRRS